MLEITSNDNGYYICTKDFGTDKFVSNYLKINLDIYHNIGIQYNGKIIKRTNVSSKELYFKEKQDAQNFMDKLTSYLIIKKLQEN
ncbi:MAG: hypothetical protein ACOCP8_10345 [archaeon]